MWMDKLRLTGMIGGLIQTPDVSVDRVEDCRKVVMMRELEKGTEVMVAKWGMIE